MQTTTERRWVRRTDHRLIAGVAGGLADATETPPVWWRLAFVVFTLAGGLGALIYVLLWMVIPRADLPRSAGRRVIDRFPDARSWIGGGLLTLGAVLLARQFGLHLPTGGWAFVLIAIGVVLYQRDGARRDDESASEAVLRPSATIGDPVGDGSPAWGSETGPSTWSALPGAPPPPPRRARPPRERSWLGWLSLGLAMAAAGVLWMLRVAGSAHPSLAQMFALPLGILGVGLLAGAFAGRARWTVLFGLLLVPIVVVASVITVPLTGRWDDVTVRLETAAGFRSHYEQAGGRLVLDLTSLRAGEHLGPITATLGVGEIIVVVPEGLAVDVAATVGLGGVSSGSRSTAGLGVERVFTMPGAGGPVRIDVEVGIGDVNVYRDVRLEKAKVHDGSGGGNG